MKALDQAYLSRLEDIATQIQNSELLATYLDSEEVDDYKALQEAFEPSMDAIYAEVAAAEPLQLLAFEQTILHEAFEGLYLPRILGFSVLRGEIDENYKYKRPQDQFRLILKAICESANFECVKRRIGQTVQIGFALSSDIWITNFMNEIVNKKIRYFLKNMKTPKFRDLPERKSAYDLYKKQFSSWNYDSVIFPNNKEELQILNSKLRKFLIYRSGVHKGNNKTLVEPMQQLISNEDFYRRQDFAKILIVYCNFFELEGEDRVAQQKALNSMRKQNPGFDELNLAFLLEMHAEESIDVDAQADKLYSSLLDKEHPGDISDLYNLLDSIHSKGYVNEEIMTEVKVFLSRYEGMSDIAEAVRKTISVYVKKVMTNLGVGEFAEFFNVNKTFSAYIQIFDNQHFSQSVKHLYLRYVKKLLKFYTDKRGKDYQDIKRFVLATFKELDFMRERDVKELFKTKRKRKNPEENK